MTPLWLGLQQCQYLQGTGSLAVTSLAQRMTAACMQEEGRTEGSCGLNQHAVRAGNSQYAAVACLITMLKAHSLVAIQLFFEHDEQYQHMLLELLMENFFSADARNPTLAYSCSTYYHKSGPCITNTNIQLLNDELHLDVELYNRSCVANAKAAAHDNNLLQ